MFFFHNLHYFLQIKGHSKHLVNKFSSELQWSELWVSSESSPSPKHFKTTCKEHFSLKLRWQTCSKWSKPKLNETKRLCQVNVSSRNCEDVSTESFKCQMWLFQVDVQRMLPLIFKIQVNDPCECLNKEYINLMFQVSSESCKWMLKKKTVQVNVSSVKWKKSSENFQVKVPGETI